MKEFICPECNIYFYPQYTRDNPYFLAERIAVCPLCRKDNCKIIGFNKCLDSLPKEVEIDEDEDKILAMLPPQHCTPFDMKSLAKDICKALPELIRGKELQQ